MSETPDRLPESDEAILQRIFTILGERVNADPYGSDDAFATQIRQFPPGLRAMATTHFLDMSLTMDDLGWHFLNFGEPNHVKETEAGLRELGLEELAEWFHEAYEIMLPHLSEIRVGTYDEWLERAGKLDRIDELSRSAWKLGEESGQRLNGSAIYAAWVRYARSHPERVFGVSSGSA